jgi:tetratricopeptide (TPR) repeat protein
MSRLPSAIICVLIFVHTASAQSSRTPKEFFESGINHYNLGEWKDALQDFKEAYRQHPDPAFLFNIAQCYRQLGDATNAQIEYRAYLRESPEAPNREEVERLIRVTNEAIKAQHPPATSTKAPALETATSSQSGQPLQARKVRAGGVDDAARTKRTAGIALIGTGVGLVALGGAFVGLVYQANGAATSDGVYHPNQVTNRNAFEVLDAVSFSLGGAAVVAGAVLYALSRSHRSYALSPVLTSSYAGAAAIVTF